MNKILKIAFISSIIILQACTNEELFEVSDNLKIQNNKEFKSANRVPCNYAVYDPNVDICTQINNLPNNSCFEISSGQIINVSCDIEINGKTNIEITGNNSTLKYIDSNNGYRIKIINSRDIYIHNLNIDNNNTKASYVNDTLASSGRIEVFSSDKIKFEALNINAQKIVGNTNGVVHQIYFKNTELSTITNCDIKTTDGELIMLKASRDCTVESNDLEGGWSGIATAGYSDSVMNYFGYNNNIIDNVVKNSSTAFITINDRNAFVKGNHIYNDDCSIKHGPGIRFGHEFEYLYASNATCIDNTIEDLLCPNGSYNSVGIKVDYSQSSESNSNYDDLKIEDNDIINCIGGIKISNQPGQYLLIAGNTINVTTGLAIDVFSSDVGGQSEPHHCKIQKNDLFSNSEVVKIYNSSVTLNNNTISTSSTNIYSKAIHLYNIYNETSIYSNVIKIIDNKFNLNNTNGIYYDGTKLSNSRIEGNQINNGHIGIFIGGKDNIIHNNTITNCSNKSIYLRYGSLDTTISNNTISNNFEAAIYLHSTTNTSISNNDLTFTGMNPYPWAVWKNSPASNVNCIFNGNSINGFLSESNY